jgi:vancomycin resistance protein VanJ
MRWWPGDRFFPVRLGNYFMPWLLVSLIPTLLIAGLARRTRLVVTLTISTVLISLNVAPLFLPSPGLALASRTPFKVMSYNIWGHNHDGAAIAKVIRQEQPDILLLQELGSASGQTLKAELTDLYPDSDLYFAYEPAMRQAIVSRYPLKPMAGTYHTGRTQKVIVYAPDGPIMVWNVHPAQPLHWSLHYRQMVALAEDIATINSPFIVGGDFNTTDQSEVYQLINQHLDNAHWEAGWGFGFSFPAHTPEIRGIPIPTPVVRIDHIFHSDHFVVHNARTLSKSGGSDHFPVVAELSLAR